MSEISTDKITPRIKSATKITQIDADSKFPTGHIIKIASTTLRTAHTYTTTGSWLDTHLYLEFIPTFSTSNILLQYHVAFSSTNDAFGRIVRYTEAQFGSHSANSSNPTGCTPIAVPSEDSSNLSDIGGAGEQYRGTWKFYVPNAQHKTEILSMTHMDSPATTSKIYYGFQGHIGGSGQTMRLNTAANDYKTRSVSSITIYEVAG
jgi:hypothetical protein